MQNFFDSIAHLEPKCPKCKSVIDYGITTLYDAKKQAHICLGCKSLIK